MPWVRFNASFHRYLIDVRREPKHANADGNECNANDEEGGKDGASGQDGLPGWQALLLEGIV